MPYQLSQDIQSLVGTSRFQELVGTNRKIDIEYKKRFFPNQDVLCVAIYIKSCNKQTGQTIVNEIKYIETMNKKSYYFLIDEHKTNNLFQVIDYEYDKENDEIQKETYKLFSCLDSKPFKQTRIDITNTSWENRFLTVWIETNSEVLLMDPLLEPKTIIENDQDSHWETESNEYSLPDLIYSPEPESPRPNSPMSLDSDEKKKEPPSQKNKITHYFSPISSTTTIPTVTTSTATTSTSTTSTMTTSQQSLQYQSAKIVPESILQKVRKDLNGIYYTKHEYLKYYKNTYLWDVHGMSDMTISDRKQYFDYCGYIDKDGHDLDWYIHHKLVPRKHLFSL